MISSVRTFSRALSATEIVAPIPAITSPAYGAVYHPGDTINFTGAANDFYDTSLTATSLTWTVQFRNASATNIVLGPLTGVTNGSFLIPLTGAGASNGSYRVLLVAVDNVARKGTNYADIFPAAPTVVDWASYYPFTADATDASNRYNGTLTGGASIQNDATRGNALNLSGNNQYVTFPSGIGALRTFAGWVKWRGGAPWQRIFDFGQDTQHFIFLSPFTGDGNMQCALTAEGGSYTQLIEAPPLPTNVWTHVAVVLDGRQGILYLNGQAVAVNNSVNLLPSDIAATKNYFGKSQFAADAYFNGQLDSVKINSRALAITDITAPMPLIIQPAIGTLYAGGSTLNFVGKATDYSDAPLSASAFNWSVEFHHDGLTDSFFGPLTGVTNGSVQIPTVGTASTNVLYRVNLLVTDGNGNQQAASADVLPRISLLNLATVPAGLQVLLDGQTLNSPTSVVAVVGLTRSLNAPSTQSAAGNNYNFVLWSDGGAATHNISVPTNGGTYTASYLQPSLSLSSASNNLVLGWPSWAGAMNLYGTTNLIPPVAWLMVTNAPVASNGWMLLTLPTTNATGFYRLQSP